MFIPIEFLDEEYKEITQEMVPGVEIGRYLISNYGTVTDVVKNKQVSQSYDSAGYVGGVFTPTKWRKSQSISS